MVMRADVLGAAIDAPAPATRKRRAIYLSPRGEPLTQDLVRSLAAGPGVLLLAGRFEGIDERVIEARGLREVSIGDYVLSGGELAAMVLIDAVVRLLPGVRRAGGLARRGELRGGPARIPALHPPARMGGPPHPRRAALAATTSASPSGAAPRPSASPPSAAPTSCAPAVGKQTNRAALRRAARSSAERTPPPSRASATPAPRDRAAGATDTIAAPPWTGPVRAPIKRPPHEP